VTFEGKRYRAPAQGGPGGFYTDHKSMDKLLDKGKLVDYVVENSDYGDTLTAEWIRRTFDWWGGVGNRESDTLERYLKVLYREGIRTNLYCIIQILLSVPDPEDFRSMVVQPGAKFWPEFLRVGRADPLYASEMAALEERWNLGAARRLDLVQ
jgi:hypothetical protein